MALAALVSLALACSMAPQGGENPPPTVLAPNDIKSLREKLIKYTDAERNLKVLEADRADERKRASASKAADAAKKAFLKDWDARLEKKPELAGSMPDMLALFDNCFSYDRVSATFGQVRKVDATKNAAEHSIYVPKGYKETTVYRAILQIPGMVQKGNDKAWADGRDWFKQTWDGAASNADTVYHLPHVNKAVELDPFPDYSREGAEQKEVERIGEVLSSFGETQRTYNLDRKRLFLDCSQDSGQFGLRLAAHFPQRFAGLILRSPGEAKELRLGSLTGLPVLIVTDAAGKPAAESLKKRLDALKANSCTIVDATDAYPFAAARTEIEKWMADKKRELMRTRVVLEPNDDRFKKGYWVEIGGMDPIWSQAPDQRPRIEVEADRKANRISVKAQGIESFTLVLNDLLVDLGKEFTVVVNDKAFPEKRSRDFTKMRQGAIDKLDGEYLFTVSWDCRVPKVEKDKTDAGKGEAGK